MARSGGRLTWPNVNKFDHHFDHHLGWIHVGRLDGTVSFLSKTSSAVHTIRVQRLRNQQVSGSNPLVGSIVRRQTEVGQ